MRFRTVSRERERKKNLQSALPTLYRVHLEYEGIFQGQAFHLSYLFRGRRGKKSFLLQLPAFWLHRGYKRRHLKTRSFWRQTLYNKTSIFHSRRVGGVWWSRPSGNFRRLWSQKSKLNINIFSCSLTKCSFKEVKRKMVQIVTFSIFFFFYIKPVLLCNYR